MNHSIMPIIQRLNYQIKRMPGKHIFNEGISVQEIADFEQDLNISLPRSFKVFLSHFNGGFIWNGENKINGQNPDSITNAAWNSVTILSLEEIREMYREKSLRNWKLFDQKPEVYPFIPFCRTLNGELLIFVNSPADHRESPVFDAMHEEFPSSWGMLYENFTSFLEDYINLDGQIETISYDTPTAAEYLQMMEENRNGV